MTEYGGGATATRVVKASEDDRKIRHPITGAFISCDWVVKNLEELSGVKGKRWTMMPDVMPKSVRMAR